VTYGQRLNAYLRQTGRVSPTRRQHRRLVKKLRDASVRFEMSDKSTPHPIHQ